MTKLPVENVASDREDLMRSLAGADAPLVEKKRDNRKAKRKRKLSAASRKRNRR